MSTRASSAQSSAYDNNGNHCTYSSSSAKPKVCTACGRNSGVHQKTPMCGKTTPHHTATQATYPRRTPVASPDQPAAPRPCRYLPKTAASSCATVEGGHSNSVALM